MKKKILRTSLFIFIGVCLGMIVWFGILKPVSGASQERSARPPLTKLPPIKNCVEHVKLVKADLVMQGESQVALLEVENEAYIGIVSISIDQIADRTKDSVVVSGFTPDKPPAVVIEPGARKAITLGNLSAHSPIRIGGAMFSDGTEEGCESSLKGMRESKHFHTKTADGPK
jgi:hypothetical protein